MPAHLFGALTSAAFGESDGTERPENPVTLARGVACCTIRNAAKQRTPSSMIHHIQRVAAICIGINLRGGDGLVAEQGLDIHPFGPGVEEIGGVSVVQLVG